MALTWLDDPGALEAAAREDEARALDMINLWSSNGINHRPGTPGPGFSTFMQNRRLMERQAPGLIEARRDEAGGLPSVDEFAEAIAAAAVDDTLATGDTVFVGSTEWS